MEGKKATFKIKDPMYGEEIPRYLPVTCEVVDDDYALLCQVEDVSITITPIRIVVQRPPPATSGRMFAVSGGIGKPTEAKLEKVWVEWFR